MTIRHLIASIVQECGGGCRGSVEIRDSHACIHVLAVWCVGAAAFVIFEPLVKLARKLSAVAIAKSHWMIEVVAVVCGLVQ